VPQFVARASREGKLAEANCLHRTRRAPRRFPSLLRVGYCGGIHVAGLASMMTATQGADVRAKQTCVALILTAAITILAAACGSEVPCPRQRRLRSQLEWQASRRLHQSRSPRISTTYGTSQAHEGSVGFDRSWDLLGKPDRSWTAMQQGVQSRRAFDTNAVVAPPSPRHLLFVRRT